MERLWGTELNLTFYAEMGRGAKEAWTAPEHEELRPFSHHIFFTL